MSGVWLTRNVNYIVCMICVCKFVKHPPKCGRLLGQRGQIGSDIRYVVQAIGVDDFGAHRTLIGGVEDSGT